jgi:AcrR family transcriptional regulator
VARPPSKAAHDKVLKAALHLISERGIEATSMDAIAAESGVSKATVYKHWANKDALLLEVIETMMDPLPEFDSGDPKADMKSFLRHMSQARKRDELGRLWPRVIGYAVSNPEFAGALQRVSFTPRRLRVAQIIDNAVSLGQLRGDVDPDFATDMLIGPIMHRRFVEPGTIPTEMAEKLTDYFWRVFGSDRPSPQ